MVVGEQAGEQDERTQLRHREMDRRMPAMIGANISGIAARSLRDQLIGSLKRSLVP